MVSATLIAGVMFSGCVSDTLSQQNAQSQALAEQQETSYDPAQRAQAVAEIRAKAAQEGSGELTQAYAEADGPSEPLTPQEQATRIAELERDAAANETNIADSEIARTQRSINEMRNQARNHYDSAVSQIEN